MGYNRLAKKLAHQLTGLPFTLDQKARAKASRPKLDEPQVRKILTALRRRSGGMSRKQISEELFSRNLPSAKITEALEYLGSLGLAYSFTERAVVSGPGRNRERWFAT
jgi:hypothetical protein